jgi:hypothetical protein
MANRRFTMKRMVSAVAVSVLAGTLSSRVLAEPERAIDQLKDAQDASERGAQNPSLEGAREQSGGQFDSDYDRPANTPERGVAPDPGEPARDNR